MGSDMSAYSLCPLGFPLILYCFDCVDRFCDRGTMVCGLRPVARADFVARVALRVLRLAFFGPPACDCVRLAVLGLRSSVLYFAFFSSHFACTSFRRSGGHSLGKFELANSPGA